jgi:hypothetical protein
VHLPGFYVIFFVVIIRVFVVVFVCIEEVIFVIIEVIIALIVERKMFVTMLHPPASLRALQVWVSRERVGCPEMSTASRAHPELIRCPRHAWTWIAHFHLLAAAHAADPEFVLAHRRDSITWPDDPSGGLAAGRSSRMGRAKASLPVDDRDTFLTRIVRTFLAAGVDDVVVVVGHEAESIAASFAASGLPARFVVNPNYDRGQLSSLLAGLAVVDRPGVTGDSRDTRRRSLRVGGDRCARSSSATG